MRRDRNAAPGFHLPQPFSKVFKIGTAADETVVLHPRVALADLKGGSDRMTAQGAVEVLHSGNGADAVTLEQGAGQVDLGGGNDTLVAEGRVGALRAGRGDDDVTLQAGAGTVSLGSGDDTLLAQGKVGRLNAGHGDDMVTLAQGGGDVSLGHGEDSLVAQGFVETVDAGRGNDVVTLAAGAGRVDLGGGDDMLTPGVAAGRVDGGAGADTLVLGEALERYDIAISGGTVTFVGRFSGAVLTATNVETFRFADTETDLATLQSVYGDADVPVIRVGGGTQTVTVNDTDPTISVIWDRTVQQMIIENEGPGGPTVASRAYAMVHTAIYDAWASYDATAVRVSFDLAGDNAGMEAQAVASEANKAKAMSYAAYTVLSALLPGQEDLLETVMQDRLGYSTVSDGSLEARIGIDAAQDLLALRLNDGSNQAGGYKGTFTPVNPNPLEINDITAWTPESVPTDPEGVPPFQRFLTPQWEDVEGFALLEGPDGTTDFSATLPPPPQDFFTAGFAGSVLDFDAAAITLSAALSLDGVDHAAGDTIAVSKALIGTVINQGFIDQAMQVVDISANLTEEEKIIAEFWEDAGGTAFPPGTFMTFAQFVSARDGHSLDDDASLFLAMGNAVFDSGIATWHAKVEYDYARPVRAIRDLGELGLIGTWGTDEITGEQGYVIEAWGGLDDSGAGRGTATILAENFVTFQRPNGDASPPFAEYTSGHSGFSAAGAEVLLRFTGSDDFGGFVTFPPGSIQFEPGVPFDETTLSWDTFSAAADEAGQSRLYGGIHFEEGDLNGRAIGRTTGADAYELAMAFVNGTAQDADRPFYADDFQFIA